MYFWLDYANGMEPYFSVSVPAIENINDSIRQGSFNGPEYTMFPVLNLAVVGSGGGDPVRGAYPAEMRVGWVQVS